MRSSVYLAERTEALYQALTFFEKTKSNLSNMELHLVFLSQIDFWEFELDSLVFLFENFAERSKCWNSVGAIDDKIRKHDLILNKTFLGKVSNKRYWRRSFRRKGEVFNPTELLNKVINKWNELIDICRYLLVNDKIEKSALEAGAKCKSITSYKKVLDTKTLTLINSIDEEEEELEEDDQNN